MTRADVLYFIALLILSTILCALTFLLAWWSTNEFLIQPLKGLILHA